MIKNFALFKVKEKKSDNSPDYELSTKIGDDFIQVGAGWIRESKKGTKFISIKLSEPFEKEYNGKVIKRDGYHLMPDEIDRKTSDGVDGEVIDVSQIPF